MDDAINAVKAAMDKIAEVETALENAAHVIGNERITTALWLKQYAVQLAGIRDDIAITLERDATIAATVAD